MAEILRYSIISHDIKKQRTKIKYVKTDIHVRTIHV